MNDPNFFPVWDRSESEDALAANRETAKRIEPLIRGEEKRKVLAAIRHWPPSDVLSLFVSLRTRYARKLLEWMPDEAGIVVLAELDPRLHAVLAKDETRSTFR